MAAGILKDKDEPVVQIRTTGEGPGREYAGKALAPQSRTYAGKPGADRAVTAAHVAPAAMQSFPVPDDFSRKKIGLVCGRRGGPLSAGQAAVWRRDLEAIIQGGDALVPAMAEFLQTEVIPREGSSGGFLAALHSTHPQSWKRVERLLNN